MISLGLGRCVHCISLYVFCVCWKLLTFSFDYFWSPGKIQQKSERSWKACSSLAREKLKFSRRTWLLWVNSPPVCPSSPFCVVWAGPLSSFLALPSPGAPDSFPRCGERCEMVQLFSGVSPWPASLYLQNIWLRQSRALWEPFRSGTDHLGLISLGLLRKGSDFQLQVSIYM